LNAGYLVEFAVDKGHRRKGIGKSILNKLARVAEEKDLRAIIVETQPDNKDGMDFYLANGFRMCGNNDRYYTNKPKNAKEITLFFSLDLQ
jgi:ribosomal protein S18 acetylase RimI-like enzyme